MWIAWVVLRYTNHVAVIWSDVLDLWHGLCENLKNFPSAGFITVYLIHSFKSSYRSWQIKIIHRDSKWPNMLLARLNSTQDDSMTQEKPDYENKFDNPDTITNSTNDEKAYHSKGILNPVFYLWDHEFLDDVLPLFLQWQQGKGYFGYFACVFPIGGDLRYIWDVQTTGQVFTEMNMTSSIFPPAFLFSPPPVSVVNYYAWREYKPTCVLSVFVILFFFLSHQFFCQA